MTCHVPRCNEPALTLTYPACYDHARSYAERRLEAAAEFARWVETHRPDGQLDLLGEAS